jgi:cytochrome c-type protein NapC
MSAVSIALAVCTLVLVFMLIRRPALARDAGGKIFAFLALFVLPVFVGVVGTAEHLEQSRSTGFCVSCHVMEPFGQSLEADPPHFQNNRVPRDEACYSCHTDYTMYGNVAAKWRGLRHVWVNYLSGPPAPEEIRLYTPFHNRECLYCHARARSFEEFPVHSAPETMASLVANETSCLLCHTVAHEIGDQ